MKFDRYGRVIDESPEALARAREAEAWWLERRRQRQRMSRREYIEEHDPLTPFDPPVRETPSSDPDLRAIGMTFEEETGQ